MAGLGDASLAKPPITVSRGTGAILEVLRLDSFTSGETIGSGSFGSVRKAHHPTYNDVAIKVLYNCGNKAIREAKKIRELCVYPSIINVLCMAISEDGRTFGIVMEWMKLGNLKTFQQHRVTNIQWPLRMRMLKQISEGMFYLHHNQNPPIVHRDLKAENIFVDESLFVKIGDLGLSRSMQSMMDRGEGGTASHMPPEYFKIDQSPNLKWDVYSFAIVQYEIATGKTVFEELSGDVGRLKWFILSNERPAIPPDCPTFVTELMKECWDVDPDKRPAFTDIKRRIKSEYEDKYDKCIDAACADCHLQLDQQNRTEIDTRLSNLARQASGLTIEGGGPIPAGAARHIVGGHINDERNNLELHQNNSNQNRYPPRPENTTAEFVTESQRLAVSGPDSNATAKAPTPVSSPGGSAPAVSPTHVMSVNQTTTSSVPGPDILSIKHASATTTPAINSSVDPQMIASQVGHSAQPFISGRRTPEPEFTHHSATSFTHENVYTARSVHGQPIGYNVYGIQTAPIDSFGAYGAQQGTSGTVGFTSENKTPRHGPPDPSYYNQPASVTYNPHSHVFQQGTSGTVGATSEYETARHMYAVGLPDHNQQASGTYNHPAVYVSQQGTYGTVGVTSENETARHRIADPYYNQPSSTPYGEHCAQIPRTGYGFGSTGTAMPGDHTAGPGYHHTQPGVILSTGRIKPVGPPEIKFPKRPIDNAVIRCIKKNMRQETFRDLGREFDFGEGEIDAVVADYGDHQERVHQLIMKWMRKYGTRTIHDIATCLLKIDERGVIEAINNL